jgi:hypothetical protein
LRPAPTTMAAKLTTLSAFVATVAPLAAAPAQAGATTRIAAPTALSPANGRQLDSVPPCAWSPDGTGVKARAQKTNIWGMARFGLRPAKRGRVLFTAKKSGFQSAGITLRVR